MKHLSLILVVAVHVACAGTAKIPLESHSNTAWTFSLSIGSPPELFNVIVDTGSPDLFIPGPDCPTCAGHKPYYPQNSTSAVKLDQPFEITFDDDSKVQGAAYLETVTIGDFKAENQAIGVATQYSTTMAPDQFPADGLLGLAFESLSTLKASPLVKTLFSQGQLDEQVFSLKLASYDSELFLGGANRGLFTGEITYTPVVNATYWTVTLDSIDVNQKSVFSDRKAIIDSGSSLIVLSPSDAKAFFGNIPGARPSSVAGEGFYAYPCNSPPTVSLTFNGRSFDITPDNLNLGVEYAGGDYCVAGIRGGKSDEEAILVGAPFMMSVYTVFDFGNEQVGFASLV
ncbi:hypothetical protein DFQ27_004972 [Actinomortierella ambigua]|uniref:Peptidase A1 domain-containing protein n=1 Tax=Actinomortierella ambigua TaxID=1343610 RepID=A0A9P6UCG7_9FUNG|nr:hypothetical protein DFQ27_004972 [Actinomortierella ambigua]